jgi:hypothetical protein
MSTPSAVTFLRRHLTNFRASERNDLPTRLTIRETLPLAALDGARRTFSILATKCGTVVASDRGPAPSEKRWHGAIRAFTPVFDVLWPPCPPDRVRRSHPPMGAKS